MFCNIFVYKLGNKNIEPNLTNIDDAGYAQLTTARCLQLRFQQQQHYHTRIVRYYLIVAYVQKKTNLLESAQPLCWRG